MDTIFVSQLAEDITDPSIIVSGDFLYTAHKTKQNIVFKKINVNDKSVLFTKILPKEVQGRELSGLIIGLARQDSDVVLLARQDDRPADPDASPPILADTSGKVFRIKPFATTSPDKNWTDSGLTRLKSANADPNLKTPYVGPAIPAITDPVTPDNPDTRRLRHSQKWGEFTYDGDDYQVLWNERDGYYIIRDIDNKPYIVGKIGILNSPSFDDKFFLYPGNIRVIGDSIYIPILQSTRDAVNEENDRITNPMGFLCF